MMFKSAPGKEGNQLVPDLAEGPGQASDGAKTWTYKLRQGVKFEDGTEVTSADVKYAVLRSTDKQTFPNGPAYWEAILDLPEGYKGPYKSPNMNTDSAIETPDKYTIVFHTKQPFAAFDYLAQQPNTMPVPKDKDTGAKYRNSIVSTGPYKFAKTCNPARASTWSATISGIPRPTRIARRFLIASRSPSMSTPTTSTTGSSAATSTSMSSRTGVQPAAQSRVLQDPTLKENADNPLGTRNWYTSINPTVPPLDNIECRKAIMYAMDQTAYQTAYGGQFAVGTWQRRSCRPTFRAITASICIRTAKTTRATWTRPRSRWRPAASRTASRPTSATAPSGRRRRRPPRRSSRRWVELASSSR